MDVFPRGLFCFSRFGAVWQVIIYFLYRLYRNFYITKNHNYLPHCPKEEKGCDAYDCSRLVTPGEVKSL